MLSVKGVIFDMDGLMIDSETIALQSNLQSAKELSIPLSYDNAIEMIGRSVGDSYIFLKEKYGEDYPCEQFRQRAIDIRREYYLTHSIVIKDGLIELLDYLKSRNIKMAVASSTKTEKVISNLKSINVYQYFDYIIGGDQVTESKPNPQIFIKACNGLGVDTKDALVLEDSKNGILAANSANIKVICIPDIVKHNEEITKLTYKTLSSLKEVIDFVK